MNPSLSFAAILATSFCVLTTAQAATVYNNGAPDAADGFALYDGITTAYAQDFQLTSGAHLTSATVSLFGALTGQVQGVPIEYTIYADAPRRPGISNDEPQGPGAVLVSGLAQNLTYADSGIEEYGVGIDTVTFDITPFDAMAGVVYWFGLHANTDTIIYWASAASNGTALPQYKTGDWPHFLPNPNSGMENAFSLNTTDAVPEPATWALMIGGFGMVGAALRRRRATAFA